MIETIFQWYDSHMVGANNCCTSPQCQTLGEKVPVLKSQAWPNPGLNLCVPCTTPEFDALPTNLSGDS